MYSKCRRTILQYVYARNHMTPDILAYVSEMQLLRELALGEDCSAVPLVTMLTNYEGTVTGKLLFNKYFRLYKTSIYYSFPKRNIF